MHHVELLLEPTAEAAVRADWDRLAGAGLPSLASHRHPSNRPHVTLTVVPTWDAAAPVPALRGLPLPVELGPLVCFGAGPWVLVRLVVTTEPLLRLHRELAEALGPPASRFCAVGRWVPHVSLAHGLDAAAVGAALELLSPVPVRPTVLDRARHWDSVARVEEPLPVPH